MTDLKQAIDGMAEAASAIGVPIISGNVSLYNETSGQPILPTLALSMVGLNEHPLKHTVFKKAREGDHLLLLGDLPVDYSGSEAIFQDLPEHHALYPWDPDHVHVLAKVLKNLVLDELCQCMSVVGRGGLLHALLKICSHSRLGGSIDFSKEWLKNELGLGLLSEETPRVLLSVASKNLEEVIEHCAQKTSLFHLGIMGGSAVSIQHQGLLIYSEDMAAIAASFFNHLGDWVARN